MINIDAKVKDSNGEVCRVEAVYDDEILVSYGGSHAEDSDFLKHGTYTVIEDIRSDYEQQKQHADELEKRWSALRDYLEERIETSKVDCEDNKYIYSRYKTCKNTLFKMQRLQEDNDA